MGTVCGICGRKLDEQDDPLSLGCGGDWWGCIGEIEADIGDDYLLTMVVAFAQMFKTSHEHAVQVVVR